MFRLLGFLYQSLSTIYTLPAKWFCTRFQAMKFALFPQLLRILFALQTFVIAEDLLFLSKLQFNEYVYSTGTVASGNLGLTARVVTDAQWSAMTTADFAQFKAIIIGDCGCTDRTLYDILTSTSAAWGPAVRGNIILIGRDEQRFSYDLIRTSSLPNGHRRRP